MNRIVKGIPKRFEVEEILPNHRSLAFDHRRYMQEKLAWQLAKFLLNRMEFTEIRRERPGVEHDPEYDVVGYKASITLVFPVPDEEIEAFIDPNEVIGKMQTLLDDDLTHMITRRQRIRIYVAKWLLRKIHEDIKGRYKDVEPSKWKYYAMLGLYGLALVAQVLYVLHRLGII